MLNALPCESLDRVSNRREVGSESICESVIRNPLLGAKSPDFDHVRSSKDVIVMFLPALHLVLPDAVLKILPMRPEPQVIRANTKWVVFFGTIVANLLSLRYRAIMNHPAHPVSKKCVAFPFGVVPVQDSISIFVRESSPKPATVRGRIFVYLAEKAVYAPFRKTLGFQEFVGKVISHIKSFVNVPRSVQLQLRRGICILTGQSKIST